MNRYEVSGEVPELLAAVFKGPQEVSRVLNKTAATSVDYIKDRNNNTAILIAAGQGNVETIKLLLDKGADIKDKNFYGKTVLHFASAKGHEAAVRLLLERGANVKALDSLQCSVLHAAAEGGNLNLVKLFINRGIDLYAVTSTKETLLHYAAREDSLMVANFLIEQGAYVNENNRFNMTPLHYASENGSVKVTRLLFEHGADEFAKDEDQRNVLHFACQGGHELLVKLFVNLMVDIEEKDFKGRTPLHLAAQKGSVKSVEVLLDYGASIHANDVDGKSVLHYACEAGHQNVVQVLLQQGSLVTKDVLRFFGKMDNENLLQQVLDFGIGVNDPDNCGKYLLHYASEAGHERIVRFLLDRGAVLREDAFGETVLHCACKSGSENIIRLFLGLGVAVGAKNRNRSTALNIAIANGRIKAIETLLDNGADLSDTDNLGRGAFQTAIYYKQEPAVKLLLERGLKPETKDLLEAVMVADEKLVKISLNIGVDAKDVLSGFNSSNYRIVEKLLDYGVTADDTDVGSEESFLTKTIRKHQDASWQLYLDYRPSINTIVNSMTLVEIALEEGTKISPSLIARLAVKMKYQDLYICDRVWNDIASDARSNAYRLDCENEMDKLNSKIYPTSSVSYRDILLSSDLQTLASYARKAEIVEAVKCNEAKKMFPIYQSFLYNQIRKGVWRKLLLKQAEGFFSTVAHQQSSNNRLPQLPFTCARVVCSCLKNRDLKMMIRAYMPSFDLDIHDVQVQV